MFGGFQVWYARIRKSESPIVIIELGLRRGWLVQRPGKIFSNGSSAGAGETRDATWMKRSPLAKVQSPPVAQSAENSR